MYDEPANDQSISSGKKNTGLIYLEIRYYRASSKTSHLQNEANGKTSAVKISFIWMRIIIKKNS